MKKSPINILITYPFEPSYIDELKAISTHLHISMHNAQHYEEIPEEVWSHTEILYTDHLIPELSITPDLSWIQFHRPEIGFVRNSALIHKTDLLLTTLSGAAVSTAAEYIIMMMLVLGHHLQETINCQKNTRAQMNDKLLAAKELSHSTVGIVGYGSVGRELARQLQSFKVKILAIKRNVMNPKDNGYCEPGLGDPDGNYFHLLYPIQALFSMVRDCDYVICCLPETVATQGLFTEEVFSSMKSGAYFVHIGGQNIIDLSALMNAVQHRLGGAAIDSLETESLPPDDPLWQQPNIIITPHLAGACPNYTHHAITLFIANLKKYLVGEPLYNLYDRELGY